MDQYDVTSPASPREQAHVVRMKGDDRLHQSALFKIIKREAEFHHSEFVEENFPKTVRAINRGDVQVLFVMVGQEIAGGTILFPSVHVQWKAGPGQNFTYAPAAYCEDMALFVEFAGRGYGTKFLDDVIRSVNGNQLASPNMAIIGEHSKHSKTMIKMFNRLDARLAPEGETVLLFKHPGDLQQVSAVSQPPRVKVENLGYIANNPMPTFRVRDNVFTVSWPISSRIRITGAFTRGISSFTGEPTVRLQFVSSGQFPQDEELRSVLSRIIEVGCNQIVLRRWNDGQDPLPLLRINTMGESTIRRQLKEMGAVDRMLGSPENPHAMHPHIVDFRNISRDVLTLDNPAVPSFALTTYNVRPENTGGSAASSSSNKGGHTHYQAVSGAGHMDYNS